MLYEKFGSDHIGLMILCLSLEGVVQQLLPGCEEAKIEQAFEKVAEGKTGGELYQHLREHYPLGDDGGINEVGIADKMLHEIQPVRWLDEPRPRRNKQDEKEERRHELEALARRVESLEIAQQMMKNGWEVRAASNVTNKSVWLQVICRSEKDYFSIYWFLKGSGEGKSNFMTVSQGVKRVEAFHQMRSGVVEAIDRMLWKYYPGVAAQVSSATENDALIDLKDLTPEQRAKNREAVQEMVVGGWYEFAAPATSIPLERRIAGAYKAGYPITFSRGEYFGFNENTEEHRFQTEAEGRKFFVALPLCSGGVGMRRIH